MSIFDRIKAAGTALARPSTQTIVSYNKTKAVESAIWTPTNVGFSPGEPIRPSAPKEPPRREDYTVSRNIQWVPRAEESRMVTYDQMRTISRLHGVLRTVIEKRKDELKGLNWDISVRPEYASEDYEDEVRQVRKFFEKPDLETPFDQWLNVILEDLYVIDSPALYKERDRLGRFRSLQNIDGSTFKILVNDAGRIPNAPQLAYEQIIKGQPRTGYIKPIKGMNPYITTQPVLSTDIGRNVYTNFEELYYRPYNLSSDGVYGYSHVESIIMTVNVALRRDTSFLEWFRSGNVPAGFIPVPENWTPDQIDQFTHAFNAMLAGDLAKRSQLVAFPGVGTVQTLSPLTFDAIFDQWLARIICARFNVSPIPYVSQINRAVGEEMEEASRDEGLVPMMQYLAQWFNDIIENCLEKPYLEFKWNPGQNYDKDDALMDDIMLKNGSLCIDDLREKQGKKPLENDLGKVPLILNGGTWVRVEDVINGTTQQQGPTQTPLQSDSSPDDNLPRLSITPEENNPFELSLRAQREELDDWQKFAINRLGKKSVRRFDTKALSPAQSEDIHTQLLSAITPEQIKAVFDVARQNLGRTKPPKVNNTIVELEEGYRQVLKDAMDNAMKEATNESGVV